MPMWRCPHCGTPQAETARCWVCRRSSTSCGTCRSFRRSVASHLGSPLGYCGLDRQRRPLAGDEIRACWEARPPAEEPAIPVLAGGAIADAEGTIPPTRRIEFIEVGSSSPTGDGASASAPIAGMAPTPDGRSEVTDPPVPYGVPQPLDGQRWSLWGDPET